MSDNKQKTLPEAPIKPVDPKNKLNELKLSWAGKLLFAAVATWVLGKATRKPNLPFQLRGRPEQIKAIVDAITASKSFQQELSRPGATIDSVINKMQLRNLSKTNFARITGKNFPL